MLSPDPKKILIIHGGALGDTVLFVPTLKWLRERFPNSEIVFLGSPYNGSAVAGLKYLDRTVLAYRKTDSLASYYKKLLELRRMHFDLLIDVHSTGRSRQQKLIIGARRSIGMRRGDLFDRFYSETAPRRIDRHMVAEYIDLLERLGISVHERDLHLELPVGEEHRATAKRVLQEHGIQGRFAVIHPTTRGRPPYEVWPTENFAKVADALSQSGRQVVASSDGRGIQMIEQIQLLASTPIANLAGRLNPLELAAILERADMYFGYNTGPMHIAAAVRTPIVAIFDRPGKVRPWHPRTTSRWRILMPSERQLGEKIVFAADTISAEEAIEAVRSLLPAEAADHS